MTLRPMKKAAVLKAWCALVADIDRRNGWGRALKRASTEEKCAAMLTLVHASVRFSNGGHFELKRAEKWTGEVAAMVRKEIGQ